MKKILIVIALCIALAGCATMSLESTSTAEQKRAALCQDAQTAKLLADSFLATKTVMTDQERVYWALYSTSSAVLITQYCGS